MRKQARKNIVLTIAGIISMLFSPSVFSAEKSTPNKGDLVKIAWIGSSSVGITSSRADELFSSAGFNTKSKRIGNFSISTISKEMATKNKTTTESLEENLNAIRLNENKSDYLIVQVSGRIYNNKESIQHVDEIIDLVCRTAKDAGIIPIIFEHWARDKHSSEMREFCIEAGKRNQVKVAFCGSSSTKVKGEKEKMYLYNKHTKDMHHPGPNGTYLWLCSIYSALTDKSPENIKATTIKSSRQDYIQDEDLKSPKERTVKYDHEISQEDREYLQKTAWEIHQKYSEQNEINFEKQNK
ncbi:MAG: hypothetical protein ACTSYG_08695 [Candidatus Heimdallarchaeota archaeon]